MPCFSRISHPLPESESFVEPRFSLYFTEAANRSACARCYTRGRLLSRAQIFFKFASPTSLRPGMSQASSKRRLELLSVRPNAALHLATKLLKQVNAPMMCRSLCHLLFVNCLTLAPSQQVPGFLDVCPSAPPDVAPIPFTTHHAKATEFPLFETAHRLHARLR